MNSEETRSFLLCDMQSKRAREEEGGPPLSVGHLLREAYDNEN